MNIVMDFLPEEYGAAVYGPENRRQETIDMVALAMEQTVRGKNGLFVLTAEELPDFPHPLQGGQKLLLIGRPQEKMPEDMVYIIIKGGLNLIEVFCTVRAEVIRLRQWAEDLYNALLERKSIQELCTLGQEGIRNEMVVQSWDYMILAHTENAEKYDDPPWDYDRRRDRYRRSSASLEAAYTDPQYRKLAASREMNLYTNRYQDVRVLTKNVYLDEMHIANIIIIESEAAFTPGNQELSRFAMGILEYALQSYAFVGEYQPGRALRQLAELMLDGAGPKRQQLWQTLQEFGWKPGDSYFCCVLQPVNGNALKAEMEYYSQQLRTILGFGSNLVLFYRDSIVVICNMLLVKERYDTLLSRLVPFIRDNLMKMGLSEPFSDFGQLAFAYRKAAAAIKMGVRQNSSDWHFKFEDYQLPYMWEACTAQFPAEHLGPSGLKTLMDYDGEKGTDYCGTLYLLLRNKGNIVRTAEMLRISRSAMIKRVERIRELTGNDFKEPLECLHYLWVMEMQRYENRINEE